MQKRIFRHWPSHMHVITISTTKNSIKIYPQIQEVTGHGTITYFDPKSGIVKVKTTLIFLPISYAVFKPGTAYII